MQSATIPPGFSRGWRHFALTYTQPYVMMLNGGGYEVKNGSNYDFDNDFSVVIIFSTSDTQVNQGLLCKSTGAATYTPSPQLSMSYRVRLQSWNVILEVTHGTGVTTPLTGPSIQPGNLYRLVMIKNTASPASSANASWDSSTVDPYAPPFGVNDFAPSATAGGNAEVNQPKQGQYSITNIQQNSPSTATKLSNFVSNLGNTTSTSYSVPFAIQTVNTAGTYGALQVTGPQT